MKKLKEIDYKILSELIRNSKISDRALAKRIGVSQPTVTRRRGKIEKDAILSYTAIPDLEKLGYEIIAITFYAVKSEFRFPKELDKSTTDKTLSDLKKSADKFFSEHPNIILSATGRGMEKNSVMISLHEDYSSLVEFLRNVELNIGRVMSDFQSFAISTRGDRVRRLFDFRGFADHLEKKTLKT